MTSLMLPRSAALALAAALVSTLVSTAPPAAAADPKVLGTFKNWHAFALDEGGKRVCYMSTQPQKADVKGKARGEAYLLITHRPAEKSFDVVSIIAGYSYKAGGEAQVQAGKATFKLFTEGDTAWARDDVTDRKLSEALRTQDKAVVKGVSSRGTATTDTYALAGAAAAYKAINEACGVKR